MQGGVFLAPHVDVHRQGFRLARVGGGAVVLRVQVAEKVPGGVHERVHGVGLATGRGAAPATTTTTIHYKVFNYGARL